MNTLIPQILQILKILEPAPGAPANSLRDLIRAIAVSVIQDDATQADIAPGNIDPLIVDAIQAAVEQVAVLKKTSTRLRFALESLPLGTEAAKAGEYVAESIGPFVVLSGDLWRVRVFHSGAFLKLEIDFPAANNATQLLALIPAASVPDAPDLRNWTLAPGSVWIESRFLMTGATGFTGLRIAGGTLRVAAGTQRGAGRIVVPFGSAWSLSLEPEPSPPPSPGSDADALALTLPTRLDVNSNAAPVVSGAPVLSGFGSDLHFTLSGAPFLNGPQICFPMQAAESLWSITGNASALATLSGESTVAGACFILPFSSTPFDSVAEAAHGGSLVVLLTGAFDAMLASQQGGPFPVVYQ